MYEGHSDQAFGPTTYSHAGEDLMIVNIFHILGIDKPSYIDIGCNHPFNISNTALLYSRGSRGVNIDANPNLIQRFHEMRKEDKNVNVGVGPKDGTMPFYMVDAWSGLNSFDKEGLLLRLAHVPQFKITEVKQIQVTTIEKIFAQYGVPDFLSVDCEGLDESILKTMTSKPKVICTELQKDIKLPGYFLYIRMIGNLIYVREDFKSKIY